MVVVRGNTALAQEVEAPVAAMQHEVATAFARPEPTPTTALFARQTVQTEVIRAAAVAQIAGHAVRERTARGGPRQRL